MQLRSILSADAEWLILRTVAITTFESIWYRTEPPTASMTAQAATLFGTLAIMEDHAEFTPGEIPQRMPWSANRTERWERTYRLESIRQVTRGRRGSDFFNRWIEVRYGDSDHPSTVYLNDGGWRGWRPILKRTNRQIEASLKELG